MLEIEFPVISRKIPWVALGTYALPSKISKLTDFMSGYSPQLTTDFLLIHRSSLVTWRRVFPKFYPFHYLVCYFATEDLHFAKVEPRILIPYAYFFNAMGSSLTLFVDIISIIFCLGAIQSGAQRFAPGSELKDYSRWGLGDHIRS